MRLLAFLFPLILSSATANANSLRAAIPITLPPPLFLENKSVPEGILPEYIAAIAEQLGKKHSVLPVARHRLPDYLERGKIDFLCYTNPSWSPISEKLDWSAPLFLKREVIVGPAPLPKKISDLKGKTLGTALTYVYPKLSPLFNDRTLLREDAPSDEANLRKLLTNRVAYVVVDEVLLDYFKIQHPEIEKNRERLFLEEHPISCSISRKGTISKKDFNNAIQKLKASKKLEALFKKYGVSAQVL
ncbi:substrate-binding periplasmic protein [Bdellovibrio bacteriovorus]|uniref:substrate-binding periplasmic protein n=1 Tax=Bdellovibrio TaxID=958 RepID=UPI0035A88EB1